MRGARFLGGLGLIFVSAACFEPTAPSRQGLAGGGGGSGEPVLTFTIQPSTVFVDAPMTVEITARNAEGGTDATFAGAVTVAIGTNPGGGTLGGTATVNAVAGVARVDDLTIDRPGTGYTLTAAAPGATGATSAAFDVLAF